MHVSAKRVLRRHIGEDRMAAVTTVVRKVVDSAGYGNVRVPPEGGARREHHQLGTSGGAGGAKVLGGATFGDSVMEERLDRLVEPIRTGHVLEAVTDVQRPDVRPMLSSAQCLR